MQPINFCKPVRKRFVNDLKRAQREIRDDHARKLDDELNRRKAAARQLVREVLEDAPKEHVPRGEGFIL